MRKSDFVSIGSEIKTNTKLTARDDFDNLYVTEDDDPNFFGFGLEDEGGEEEKPKKKKKKKPKAGSSRTTAPAKKTTTTAKPKAKAGAARAPMVLDPSDRISGDSPKPKAGGVRNPMFLDPDQRISGDSPKPKAGGVRNPMFLDPDQRISGDGSRPAPARNPMFLDPGDRISGDGSRPAPARNSMFLDPDQRIGGAPAGSTPKAAIDSSKLTGKRPTSLAGKINSAIGGRLVGGMMSWLGPVLVAGEGAKFLADWYSYNTGAARVTQLGDYTAPCLDSSYDPYDDPFVDIYGDDAGKTYNLDYYGKGFKDILNSYDVEAFTPRMSNLIYGVIPTLLTSIATGAVLFQTIGRVAFVASGATGPGILIGAAAAVISIGIGWAVSAFINRMLKKVDQWGPGAADVVAQFAMEQLTTSSSLQMLCGANLSEAAQDDEYQDRDEESSSAGAVDTFAIMELAATIKEVFKEIDQELQAEGNQEKLAEWRRILKQAKETAKDQIKG
jgi:hypothetical protein